MGVIPAEQHAGKVGSGGLGDCGTDLVDLGGLNPDRVDAAEDDPAPVTFDHDRAYFERKAISGSTCLAPYEADHRQPERRPDVERGSSGEQRRSGHTVARSPETAARLELPGNTPG